MSASASRNKKRSCFLLIVVSLANYVLIVDNSIWKSAKVVLLLPSNYYNQWTLPTVQEQTIDKSIVSIPPSKMKVHYHEMWNHTTSTIVIPDEYKNPFNVSVEDENGNRRRPLTSLEILQNVLHGIKYRAEFEAVEAYMDKRNVNNSAPMPKCLSPDVQATQKLANRIVQARIERQQQHQQLRLETKREWQYDQLMLPLPILNVGYPKTGSSTLKEFFNCIGLKADHMQNGMVMFERLAEGKDTLFGKQKLLPHAYTQLDYNFKTGYYPQISLLDELHELRPDSTFVFNFRPIADWIRSAKNWHGMMHRFARFDIPGLVLTPDHRVVLEAHRLKNTSVPGLSLTHVQMAKWWCGHVLHIREYVREYPSHAIIELDLYDSNGTTSLLYDLFQTDTDAHHASKHEKDNGTTTQQPPSQQCWGHGNKSPGTKKRA